jgi:hypothetical protein
MEAIVHVGLNADILGKGRCSHTHEFGGLRKGGLQADLKHEAFATIHTTFSAQWHHCGAAHVKPCHVQGQDISDYGRNIPSSDNHQRQSAQFLAENYLEFYFSS